MLNSKKAAAREVLRNWLFSDGFQEGADGASAVIDLVWGEGTADVWVKEVWEEQAAAKAEAAAQRKIEKPKASPPPFDGIGPERVRRVVGYGLGLG